MLTRVGSPQRRLAAGLFLLLAAVYALTASGHTSSPDEEGMLAQARALASGTWKIDIDATNDSVTSRRQLDDGSHTGLSNLGTSVVALPLLAVGSLLARGVHADHRIVVENLVALFTNNAITAATAVVLFWLSMRLGAPRRRAILLALVFGLGTYAWPHARSLFSEPLAALCLLGAIAAAVAGLQDRNLRATVLAGVCLGAGAQARATSAVFIPVVGAYVVLETWRRWGIGDALRAGVACGVPATIGVAVLLTTNALRYGSPTDLGPPSVPFEFPVLEGLANLYLSPGKSLFLYAPIVLVAVLALPITFRRRPAEVLLLLTVVVANSVLFARFLAWHGDQAWGPRYLQITLPCAVALAAPALASIRWARAAAVAGVLGALGPAALGVLIYPNAYFQLGNATPELTGRIEANGERRYINAFHFDPYWSPLLGHARMVPKAVANTTSRFGGVGEEVGRIPAKANDRYFWWDFLEQVDVWWLWVPSARLSRWLLAVVPVLAAVAAGGAGLLRSGLRLADPATDDDATSAGVDADLGRLH